MHHGNPSANHQPKISNTAYRGHKDGSVEFFGDQIRNLTGYPKEDFNSNKIKWTELIVEEDREGSRKTFIEALKTDKTYMREYRIRNQASETLWVQEWGQIICDDSGAIDFVLGILLDITERRKLEAARLKAQQLTGKYLTFFLDREEFCLSILQVREIIGLLPITPVPGTPAFLKGVINLRGKVIPVLDLRLKFAMEGTAATEHTCIVLVDVKHGDEPLVVGIIVDSVSEVYFIRGEDIEDPPEILARPDCQYILGLAKTNGRVKILLDLDRLNADGGLTGHWQTR